MENEKECGICCLPVQGKLRKLVPCGHRLCDACANKLAKFATIRQAKRCPYCRQEFECVHEPNGLVDICLSKIQWRLPSPANIRRLPVHLRLELLAQAKNRRLLYGDVLYELLWGAKVEQLCLDDSTNLEAADLKRITPLLGPKFSHLSLKNVPLLNDDGLLPMLQKTCGTIEVFKAYNATMDFKGTSLLAVADKLIKLRHIEVPNCGCIESSAIASIARGTAATLTVADFGGCRRLTNDAVLSLARCTNLEDISFSGCWKIETDSVLQLLAACSELRKLNLQNCKGVSGPQVLRAVAAHCQKISDLCVSSLPDIEDAAVLELSLSTAGAFLRSLGLAGTDITYRSLRTLSKHCPELQRLDISSCNDVSEDSLLTCVMEMTRLKICQMKYCRKVSNHVQLIIAQLLAGRQLGIEDTANPKVAAAAAATGNTEASCCGGSSSVGEDGRGGGSSSSSASTATPSDVSSPLSSGSSSGLSPISSPVSSPVGHTVDPVQVDDSKLSQLMGSLDLPYELCYEALYRSHNNYEEAVEMLFSVEGQRMQQEHFQRASAIAPIPLPNLSLSSTTSPSASSSSHAPLPTVTSYSSSSSAPPPNISEAEIPLTFRSCVASGSAGSGSAGSASQPPMGASVETLSRSSADSSGQDSSASKFGSQMARSRSTGKVGGKVEPDPSGLGKLSQAIANKKRPASAGRYRMMASQIIPNGVNSTSSVSRSSPTASGSRKGNEGEVPGKRQYPQENAHVQRGQELIGIAQNSMSESSKNCYSATGTAVSAVSGSVPSDTVQETPKSVSKPGLIAGKSTLDRQILIQQAKKSLLQSNNKFDPVKAQLLLAKIQVPSSSSSATASASGVPGSGTSAHGSSSASGTSAAGTSASASSSSGSASSSSKK